MVVQGVLIAAALLFLVLYMGRRRARLNRDL
jgi:hypothetical protein